MRPDPSRRILNTVSLWVMFFIMSSAASFLESEVALVVFGLLSTTFCSASARWIIYRPEVWASVASFFYAYGANVINIFEPLYLYQPYKTAWIASIFHIAVCSGLILLGGQEKTTSSRINLSPTVAKLSLFVSSALVILNNIVFAMTGSTSKREFSAINEGVGYFGFSYNFFIVSFVAYFIVAYERRAHTPILATLVVIVISFITLLNTGERDVFFKVCLSLAFMMLLLGLATSRSVYIGIALLFIFVPFSKSLGVAFGADEVDITFTGRNIIVGIMMSDFMAAGSNLDILLIKEALYAGDSLMRLWADIVRGFLPSTLSPTDSSAAWFYKQYTPYAIDRRAGGLGFSLMGAFYIYGGLVGVLLGGAIFSGVASLAWRRASTSHLSLAFYCASVPLLIWCLRGDLSTIISSLLKQTALPLVVIVVLSRLVSPGARAQTISKAPAR